MANQYTGGKWNVYDEQIKGILELNEGIEPIDVVKQISNDFGTLQRQDFSRYIRRNTTRILDVNEGIYDAAASVNINFTSAKNLWIKTKNPDGSGVSAFVVNPNYQAQDLKTMKSLQDDLIESLQVYSPKFVKLERVEDTNSYLLVLDPADIHVGKLCSSFEVGEAYNNQIAVQRALFGVQGILQKVSSFNIDKILFIGGNDILHIDSPKRETTSGTKQDTDGMWHTNFLIAKQLYVDILEMLITVADVHFCFNPSNHDYASGFFLSQVIEAYFKNCENISFDSTIAHRKYFKYFKNLIGTTHGDGAKMTDLPMLMATEMPKEWSETEHRYVYVHHLHHKWSKDVFSVCVEGLRSPSGTDSWHHRNGYEHAPKAVEGFLHSKYNGQIARITHIF